MKRNFNVLVAEDNDTDYLLLDELLKSYNIDRATNGREAIDKFSESNYDLVLMNLRMPVIDGLQATEYIRVLDNFTPIYMVSSQVDLKNEALSVGVDKFYSKPLDVRKFRSDISDLVNEVLR
jgi:CheY-like chemotaxis protein